jgi:CPA1 family monovalent cation:H+ antiporter
MFGFWNLVDEILNSVLFLAIGLEVLVLQFTPSLAPIALAAVPIVLLARFIAVSLAVTALSFRTGFVKGTIPILVWGGIRGGISIALALSIPAVAEKPMILAATYLVVLFTIVVQSLTFPRVVKKVRRA